jgi:UDP-N-acetylmuramoyl-tripeptide--D-alanyl-D-alanine ligase
MMRYIKLTDIGKWLNIRINDNRPFIGFSIDSRTIKPGEVFLALNGSNCHGNNFVKHALSRGASYAIASEYYEDNDKVIPVACVQDALNIIGSKVREYFTSPIVAVTGSCGKTTTKNMIFSLLKQNMDNVFSSQGNFNNHLGVPLMLSKLNNQYDYAVLECGASAAFEIKPLVKLIKPYISLITNVHEVHLEGFGTIDVIAKTKGEIYSTLDAHQIAVMPEGSVYLKHWQKYLQKPNVVTFGLTTNATVHAKNISYLPNYTCFDLVCPDGCISTRLNIPGKLMLLNLLAAVAVVINFGLTLAKLEKYVPNLRPESQRLEFKKGFRNGLQILDDSYNSNSTALQAAVDILLLQKSFPIVVMGDMGEIGTTADIVHKNLGAKLKAKGVRQLWATGPLSALAIESFGANGFWFENKQDLVKNLKKFLSNYHNDVCVLVKGSRFSKLEDVVKELESI